MTLIVESRHLEVPESRRHSPAVSAGHVSESPSVSDRDRDICTETRSLGCLSRLRQPLPMSQPAAVVAVGLAGGTRWHTVT